MAVEAGSPVIGVPPARRDQRGEERVLPGGVDAPLEDAHLVEGARLRAPATAALDRRFAGLHARHERRRRPAARRSRRRPARCPHGRRPGRGGRATARGSRAASAGRSRVVGVSSLPAARISCGCAAATFSTSTDGADHHVRDIGHLGGVVVEVGDADQPVAGSQGADDLGVGRGEADDPRRGRGERDLATGVIGQGEGVGAGRLEALGAALTEGCGVVSGPLTAGAQAARTRARRRVRRGGRRRGAMVMPFPFTRGGWTSRAGWRPGSRTHRSGYSCGTAPASHRLLH